ncbi:hypothetical protein CMI37_05180 [Candidatus Pacearchaeota archaeon]|nr:hypothetical protein [Candidatus Pacearchaeota archaeon]|tara:strand:+ start:3263 stop:3481 length:219 start_codon:yes stop_codon:yes gene_type:complete
MTEYRVVYDIKMIGAKWIDATDKKAAARNTIGFLYDDSHSAWYRLNMLLKLLDLSVVVVETKKEARESRYKL